jgi:hypothetical protein
MVSTAPKILHEHNLPASSNLLLRSLLLVGCFFAAFGNPNTFAQNCDSPSSIPTGHKKLGSGSATVHYDGTTRLKGGQSVYVKIKNDNVLGVSYTLTISPDAKPEAPVCTYKALIPPRTTVILSGALFAEPPISWKITVAVGDESDAGVLTYEVYSNPKESTPKALKL